MGLGCCAHVDSDFVYCIPIYVKTATEADMGTLACVAEFQCKTYKSSSRANNNNEYRVGDGHDIY